MTQTSTLATLRAPANPQQAQMVKAGFDTAAGFDLIQRTARLFASSDIVPKQYKGNLPNCVIAVDMALRMGANPLMVCQNLYIVHERPAWSAQFLIATLNQCGRFSSIRYEFQSKEGGDDWGCRAVATELSTGEKLTGPLITIGLAKKEGWYAKNGSKWQTMPELMLRYRAASWFVCAYAPEIAMGLSTADEVRDTIDMAQGDDGVFETSVAAMKDQAQYASSAGSCPEPEAANGQADGQTEKRSSSKRKHEAAPAPALAPEQEETQAAQQAPALSHDPQTGEMYGPASYLITCPNTGKHVDELECVNKSCRNGCPEFEG